MRAGDSQTRVLAIDPIDRGFGFVVFEGPEHLIDWGVAYVGGDRHSGSLLRISALIRRYDPDALVIEDHKSRSCRRQRRAKKLLKAISGLGSTHAIAIHRETRRAVRAAFSNVGVATKLPIAAAIASRFPDLAPFLPPKRKPWMHEDARLGVFDAAALAVAYFEAEIRSRAAAV